MKYLVDKELPLADANVLFAMEGPMAKKDVADNLINPARKAMASYLRLPAAIWKWRSYF